MKPLTIFLDYWVIKRLFERASNSDLKERLVELIGRDCCSLVLSIWHVHEMLRDENRERAKNVCLMLDRFVREISCLWIGLRTEIQKDEIAAAFFKSQGIIHNRSVTLHQEMFTVFPGYEKWSFLDEAREEGLLYFFNRPKLFKDALEEQKGFPVTKSELRAAKANIIGAEQEIRNTLKIYVKGLLPMHYPGVGIRIAPLTKQNFLADFDVKSCPSVYVEYLLSNLTTADAQTPPTESDMVDMQHIVSVLPYVDVAVLDAKFANYARAIKMKWNAKSQMAQVFPNIREALDSVERSRCRP